MNTEKVTFGYKQPSWNVNWVAAFNPSKWAVKEKGETSGRNGKPKREYLALENEEGQVVNVLTESLVALQIRENMDVLLVDDKKGTRRAAEGDEDCYLNGDLNIGCNKESGLYIP